MRTRRLLVTTLLLALAAPAVAQQRKKQDRKQPRLPDSIVVERDVQYGAAGDRALKLDVIRPKTQRDRPRPVVVWIHGGGWRNGNKSGGAQRLAAFAASGNYVCVSVGYRLSGEAKWPAQIHDCKAAIRWIKANAKKLDIDPERIGVWGSSAGGHLVSLLGTSGGVKELEGDNGSPDASSRVACVVDYCGPSNFLDWVDNPKANLPDATLTQLFGAPIKEKEDLAAVASPATHVSSDDPPFLIVHGTEDPLVPLSQAEILHTALKKAGVDATFVKMQGGGHGIGGGEITARVTAFLDKHLLGKKVEISAEPIHVTPLPERKKRKKSE